MLGQKVTEIVQECCPDGVILAGASMKQFIAVDSFSNAFSIGLHPRNISLNTMSKLQLQSL